MKAHIKQENTYLRTRLAIRVLVGVLIFLGVMYIYGLVNTTAVMADQRSLEIETSALASAMSEKEMIYLSLANDIGAQDLGENGFREADHVYFASLSTVGDTVAFATQ